MNGNEILMVSGSDEHGTPITVTAEKEKVTPEVIAKRFHGINTKALKELGISFDLFFETSDPNHREVVHDIFLTLLEKKHIYKKTMESLFCNQCQRFLPDRYVEGQCPHCDYESARGDQCDECGKPLDPVELIAAKCKICGSYPEVRETDHFFFRLSQFQDELMNYASDKDHWRHNTKNFTRNWLASGLRDRPITRDINWGVDIPLEGYENKRIYVWFEAVIGYLSTSKEWSRRSGNPAKWSEFWQDAEVRHYYFLGKDNIPFHTIIWPAILLGYGGLNLPYDVPANEYLRFAGEQFSKSRGVTIDIPNLLEHYDPDQLRYYLAINMPENRDSDFSWEDFESKINSELVGALGNFIHRTLTFTAKNFGKVPELDESLINNDDKEALKRIDHSFKEVGDEIENCHFKSAMKKVMELAHFSNRYFDKKAPWALIKTDKIACGNALHFNLQLVKSLCILMYPFLPHGANRLWKFLGNQGSIQDGYCQWSSNSPGLNVGQSLARPKPLFNKIEIKTDSGESKIEKLKEKKEIDKSETKKKIIDELEEGVVDLIKISDFQKINLRIGQVIKISDHPDADKLYVLQVDFGSEQRQLVAGLRGHYEKDEILNKKIVVIMNLEPAKLRGVESNGMLLAADDGKGGVSLLTLDRDIALGSRVK
jgi:methionyl-tRNA synthetase